EPRGFGFVQYVDPADAAEAKYQMDGQVLHGRELTVVFAEENRKKPTEMRARERGSRGRVYDRRRSPPRYSRSPRHSRSPPSRYARSPSRDYYSPRRRSRSPRDRRSYSRSPPPPHPAGRDYSPAPYDGRDRSVSPPRPAREQSPPYSRGGGRMTTRSPSRSP
ncbi:hypothetical protein M569_13042, partial [Genlisea aurea]